MGVAGLFGGKENRIVVFWKPAKPVDWNGKETFRKESRVLKSENSSGESGFLEKIKPTGRLVFLNT